MSNNVSQDLDKTAFGELSVAEPTPEVQISAVNGLRDDTQKIFAGTGSGVSVVDGNYVCNSGSDTTGLSSVLSSKEATYRNGQGLGCRITALFKSGIPNAIQLAGFINGNNAFAFGYNGTEYGIVRAYDGVTEFQELEVTTAATGAENATITIDGTGYTVPLTSGTEEHNAYEIAVSLNSQVPNYSFTSNGVIVSGLAAVPIAAGAFAFSSATAVATWTQINIGQAATFDWIPQTNWTNPPNFALDPEKGNVYQIKVQYLGYGGIKFYIENPVTTDFDLVHIYEYSNAHTVPSVNNPTFRVGWAVQNLGNTTPIELKGASAEGFIEGKKVFDESGRGMSAENIALGATRVNVLTLRNRLHMNNSINRISVYPTLLVTSAAHNKTVILYISVDETFLGDLDFKYIDEVNSAVEYANDGAVALGTGREVGAFRLRSPTPLSIPMERLLNTLPPRQALTISAETSSGTGAEVDVSIAWNEDP